MSASARRSVVPAVLIGVLALSSAHSTSAAPERHRVKWLPGLRGSPVSDLYSGFLITGEHHVHYMLAESQGNPSKDPLVLWLNGGPGSSSLIGFFQELGPVVVASNSSLIVNPYAWNRFANILFLETPTGVGYSSCADSRAGGKCMHDDTSTAHLNLNSLQRFLELFPEYAGREFMIWGESYAGVYIPMLADLVYESTLDVSFLGFSVGDPCTDERFQHLDDQLHFNLRYALDRGFISSKIYSLITSSCTKNKGGTGHLVPDYTNAGCRAAWRLYYIATSGDDGYVPWDTKLPHGGYIDPYTCYGPSGHDFNKMLSEYLNTEAVQYALHAPGQPWGRRVHYSKQYMACFYEEETNPAKKPQYNTSMLPIYLKLAGKLRTLVVFNGDTDPDVQFQGTESAVAALGLPLAEGGEWRPWFYKQQPVPIELLKTKPPFWGSQLSHTPLPGAQLAGYVTNYAGNLSFVTVHNSGHMVPQFQPQAALHFFKRTLQGLSLSPLLDMSEVCNATDEAFFGDGYMKRWVELAQSRAFSEQPPSGNHGNPELLLAKRPLATS